MTITSFLIARRDAAADVWLHEVGRITLHHPDAKQEARARRAQARLAAWDHLLTTWAHITRSNR